VKLNVRNFALLGIPVNIPDCAESARPGGKDPFVTVSL